MGFDIDELGGGANVAIGYLRASVFASCKIKIAWSREAMFQLDCSVKRAGRLGWGHLQPLLVAGLGSPVEEC
ncbi:unnamed protein product [Calypogeia fissa]